ncbi:MAG: hypothetical protein JNL21_23030 [Myxococcales bacterium]|nr:hypothetical protein [Myxococcales bacterium]
MRALRFALFAAAASSPLLFALACGGDPPEPGFEEVGGSGEGAGGPSSTKASSTSSSMSNTTTSSGPTTTTSSTTTSTTTASTTTTGSSGCNDLGPGEPNDTEAAAHDLGTIGDCDDRGGSVSGLLDGATDPDWYKYHATDASSFCTTDPDRTVTSSDPIRICKFVQCDDNEANDFECPSGTSAATSPDGRPGCCGTSAFEFSLTCGSSSIGADNAMVYIRIDTQENACVTYTLTYAY